MLPHSDQKFFLLKGKQFRGSISDDYGDEVVESGSPPEKLMAEVSTFCQDRELLAHAGETLAGHLEGGSLRS